MTVKDIPVKYLQTEFLVIGGGDAGCSAAIKAAENGVDTMILDAPPQAQAILYDFQGNPRVSLSFSDFPYLGIWTQNKPFDTGYVCIEPWSTLPDGTFMGRELGDKPGIRHLAPGESETLSYTTIIY